MALSVNKERIKPSGYLKVTIYSGSEVLIKSTFDDSSAAKRFINDVKIKYKSARNGDGFFRFGKTIVWVGQIK